MKEKVSDRGGCIQGAGALLLLLLLCTKELVVQIPAHHVQHFCKLASTLLLLRVRAPVHSMHYRVQFFYFYPILLLLLLLLFFFFSFFSFFSFFFIP